MYRLAAGELPFPPSSNLSPLLIPALAGPTLFHALTLFFAFGCFPSSPPFFLVLIRHAWRLQGPARPLRPQGSFSALQPLRSAFLFPLVPSDAHRAERG